jgi:Family of unknown function (DUF5399)
MATIDKLDISVYNLYAIRTKMIEQINTQYRLDQASTIPGQVSIVDAFPKLTELDLLLGIVPLATPWAYFYPPKAMRFARRSSFAFFRVAPTLGSLKDQEEDFQTLTGVECNTPEEQKEKEAISGCFSQLDQINGWLGFIMGRVGQFLQG